MSGENKQPHNYSIDMTSVTAGDAVFVAVIETLLRGRRIGNHQSCSSVYLETACCRHVWCI